MKLTNKGRYAVMAMADLALNAKNGPISLAEISLRQNISLAYLEQIFVKLKNTPVNLSSNHFYSIPFENKPKIINKLIATIHLKSI